MCVCVACLIKFVPSSPITTIEIEVREEYSVKKLELKQIQVYSFAVSCAFQHQLEKIAIVMAK